MGKGKHMNLFELLFLSIAYAWEFRFSGEVLLELVPIENL